MTTARQFPRAEVQLHNGRSFLAVDGRAVHPMAYTTSFRLTGEQAERLAGAGIQLYFLWIDSGWHELHNRESWRETEEEYRQKDVGRDDDEEG